MKTESCKTIIATAMNLESWLIGILGATIAITCVFIGHKFTLQINKNKAKALEAGFYNEFDIIKEYFQTYLPILINEFKQPVQQTLSGFSKVDMNCVDALVVELISMNKILTKDQRNFILSLKSKLISIEKKDFQRDEASPWNEHKDAFIISKHCTARLIVDSTEAIIYLSHFIKSKSSFKISEVEPWESKVEQAFADSKIEFESRLWQEIIARN